MKARQVAISGAAFLVLTFPVFVASAVRGTNDVPAPVTITVQTPAPAEPPAPIDAALSAHFTAQPGFSEPQSYRLFVRAQGSPPAAGVLRSDDGSVTADVIPYESCAGEPRSIGLSPEAEDLTDWCLRISELPSGIDVTGTLTGEGSGERTALSLTIGARDNYWGWPLAMSFAGFAGSLIVLGWMSWLKKKVKSAQVDQILERNRQAGAAEIHDLAEWVSEQKSDKKKSDAEILPTIHELITNGPHQMWRARDDLARSLRDSKIPNHHPFVVAAWAVVRPRTLYVKDFLDEEDKPRASLEPSDWLASLQELEQIRDRLDLLWSDIIERLPDNGTQCRNDGAAAWRPADRAWKALAGPDGLSDLRERLNETATALRAIERRTECQPRPRDGGLVAAGFGSEVAIEFEGQAFLFSPPSYWTPIRRARAITVITVVVAVAYAFLTIFFSVYLPKPTFGTVSDYWELLGAVTGSSLLAILLGVFATWEIGDSDTK